MTGAALKLIDFFFFFFLLRRSEHITEKQQTEMCPQGDCRNKQPTGNLPTPKSECWKSRLLSTVAHTGTRNVHWHLEKHPLVWMEEVIDPELYFN